MSRIIRQYRYTGRHTHGEPILELLRRLAHVALA